MSRKNTLARISSTQRCTDVHHAGRVDLFLTLKLVLDRIAGSSGGGAAGSNDLAAVVEAVQDPKGQLSGRRAFVLLMLHHGAGGPGHMLRRTLEAAGDGRYRGLMDDVLEVARWRRWIGGRLIGGLPPELTQEIMFRTWIEMLR